MLDHGRGGEGGRRAGYRLAFAGAVVVQMVVLYWPRAVGDVGLPGLDKVVHAAVFGAVALTGRRSGLGVPVLAVGLALHAVVSEVVQGALHGGRSGDPLDVVADLVGTALGLAAATWWSPRRLAVPRGQAR